MAFDGTKWSDGWSTIRSFAIDIDTEVPITPSPIDGTNVGDATPFLDWENIAGATGYHIQINTKDDFSGITVTDDNSLTFSEFSVTTPLENNTTYYWRVKIKDSGSLWGDWSGTWNFNVDVVLGVPANPNPSNGSTIIDTTPLLEWGNVTGALSYEIEISTVSNFSSFLETDNGLGVLQYQVTTVLSKNETYYWRVRIYNEDNVAGNWSTWSFTIDMEEANSPSPNNGEEIIDTTPLLSWGNVASASSYEIEISTVSNFNSTLETASGLGVLQYQVTTVLSNNVTYYWRVRIYNEDNIAGDWNAWSLAVNMNEADSPSPDSGGSTVNTTPFLDWGDVIGASYYEIEISDADDFSNILETDNSLSSSQYQVVTELANKSIFYWRVRISNENNVAGDWSVWIFNTSVYAIRDLGPAGGLVFYSKGSYSDGWCYMEAAPSDEGTDFWGPGDNDVGTENLIGTGEENTIAIVDTLISGSWAGIICADLIINGYDDWFLPSIEELNLMYHRLYYQEDVGDFSPTGKYWSSSENEYDWRYAWYQNFANGTVISEGYKNSGSYRIRAARKF